MRAALVTAAAMAACETGALDACARFGDHTCLVVRARGRDPVEQLELTALSGFALAPNPARTPSTAGDDFELPARVPIDLGNFAGEFRLRVAGLRGGSVRALDEVEDTIARGERKLLEVQLLRIDSDGGVLDLAVELPDLAVEDGDPGECTVDCGILPGVDPATVRCLGARCDVTGACLSGRGHCSAAWQDGCEADFTGAPTCGSCSNTCSGATPLCSMGSCVASCSGATPTQCGSGCVSFEDPQTCGSCDMRCGAPSGASATCDAGRCGWQCAPDSMRVGDTCVQWKVEASNTATHLTAIHGPNPQIIYVGGRDGLLLRSTGNGVWSPSPYPSIDDITAIWGLSETDLYVTDVAGAVFHRVANNWARTQVSTGEQLWSVSGNGSSVWLLSTTTIFQKNGSNWVPSHTDENLMLFDIWAGTNAVFAVGQRRASPQPPLSIFYGELLQGPSFWESSSTGIRGNFSVWGASDNDVYIVGANGSIARYRNGQLTHADPGTFVEFRGVGGTGPDDVYAVGDQGTIFHSTGNGVWTQQESGAAANLTAVFGTVDGGVRKVWVVGDGGLILRKL